MKDWLLAFVAAACLTFFAVIVAYLTVYLVRL